MTPVRSSFILATAGHVDHGKSSLVRALTGAEADRLPAEKSRGVTIELGFAHLSLGDVDVGVIDVPGHEDFVKNMVAGVGAIDVALLVVAADDGWMPQTEEHLQILTYLGVRRAVVAMTKVDLARDADGVESSIRARLIESPFADAPIVRTSTRRNEGVDTLGGAIEVTLAGARPRVDVDKPRLAVDRAFSIRGVGTVVTGTLVGGSIARGDAVVVQPSAEAAHVRLAQTHNREVERAVPGSRVALNLPELEIGGTIHRGDVVTRANVGVVTQRIDVVVDRSPRDAAAKSIASGLRVIVHHGAATAFATLRSLDRSPIEPARQTLAHLELERPMLLLVGDRLLLRDSAQRVTLAGAIVLDASPPTRRRANAEGQTKLLALRQMERSVATILATQVERDGVVAIAAIDRATDASAAEIALTIDAGVARGAWRRVGDRLIAAAVWAAATTAIASAADAHHAAHPEHVGIAITRVRGKLDDALFEAILADLCKVDFERVGATLRRRSHRAVLPPRLQPAGEAIRRALDARPFDPPSRKEIAGDDTAIQALRFLIANAAVIEISADVCLSDSAYRAAAAKVAARLADGRGATVSELKQLLGSSRRVTVPLLECFDRDGITRRVGDRRELGSRASS